MNPPFRAFHHVYAVAGPDRFLRNEAIESIVAGVTGEIEALGPMRVDGADAELAEVCDELRTFSLLGGRRLVIVDDADCFISAHRSALERYCSDPAETGTLILACNTLPKNTRLYKIIGKCGAVIHCHPPDKRAVLGWIKRRAREKHDKEVTAEAARALREHLGDSPGVLAAELTKLAAYVGRRPDITPADIDALTGHHREEKVFAVTDALSAGDTAGALRHWEQVLATDRAAPARAIAGLAWGVRRLLEAKRDLDAGVTMREVARRLYADPNTLERRLARKYIKMLEEQQHDLLRADLAIKTGAATVDSVVERFIVKHSIGSTSSAYARAGS
ncbi:MAG: DNA polymerase III subunit delta [Phycisphaerae bacterium]